VTHIAKSLSKEHTFAQDVQEEGTLRQTLRRQAAEIASALQRKGMQGTTITLKLRWSDFTTLTRQTTLSFSTNEELVNAATTLRLFAQAWQVDLPVRLIGVGVSGLGAPGTQATLWESMMPQTEQRRQVEATMLELRARFGERIIWWGYEWNDAEAAAKGSEIGILQRTSGARSSG
jgi:DNA polymerase-4